MQKINPLNIGLVKKKIHKYFFKTCKQVSDSTLFFLCSFS